MRYVILLAAAIVCFAVVVLSDCDKAEAQATTALAKMEKALPDKAPAKPKQSRKILLFSKTAGFRHKSIDVIGARAMVLMGEKTGAYLCVHTEDESFFEPERLKAFDAVFMLNTTNDCLKPKAKEGESKDDVSKREEVLKQSLKEFVTSGKGLIGIHAATDTYHNWKDYAEMMGGTFQSHPWSANSTVVIKNLEPKNPVNAAFDGKGFEITDEIYVFRAGTALPTQRRFLLSLDDDKMDTKKGKRADGLYPISWISTYGKGRVFYCSLGHNNEIYHNPAVLRHYLAGIQYALGDLEADATPVKSK